MTYIGVAPFLLWALPLIFCLGSALIAPLAVATLANRNIKGRSAYWFWLAPVVL